MTAKAVTGLHIPADTNDDVVVVDVTPTLEGVRLWVGLPPTYLESITMDAEGTHLYVDEDGRSKGLPVNLRATALVLAFRGGVGTLVGDALLIGSDDHGDEASLTVRALARATSTLGVTL